MQVRLLSYVAVTDHVRKMLGHEPGVSDGDLLVEYAGRVCYESWHKPNPETRTNSGYVSNIQRRRHDSVFEHANYTFLLEGVSLALMWELTRHRHFSYSIRSTRYCAPKDFAVHPTLAKYGLEDEIISDLCSETWDLALERYQKVYEFLREQGEPVKGAREAAAQLLPVMTSTTIVITGNIRAWREMIAKRNQLGANAEIRMFACMVLAELKKLAPNSFSDLKVIPEVVDKVLWS